MIQAIASDRTTQWHSLRSTGVGASEASAVCGLSPYETALDVWAKKVGRKETKATPVMELGTHLEPFVFDAVERAHPIAQRSPGLFRHKDIDCVLASPDGFLADGRGLECKVTSDRNSEIGEGGDELPASWLCQASQQMAVCDLPAVVFSVVVLPSGVREWLLDNLGAEAAAKVIGKGLQEGRVEIRYWNIDRNERVISGILNRDVQFWQHVVDNSPPPVDWEHERACLSVKTAFREVFHEGAFAYLDESFAALWQERQRQKAIIKEAEKFCERADAELFLRIQDKHGGLLPSGSVLKKITVGETLVPAYTRKGYSFLRETKGPK